MQRNGGSPRDDLVLFRRHPPTGALGGHAALVKHSESASCHPTRVFPPHGSRRHAGLSAQSGAEAECVAKMPVRFLSRRRLMDFPCENSTVDALPGADVDLVWAVSIIETAVIALVFA